MIDERRLSQLPGGTTILRGLSDLRSGRRSVESHLIDIARTRLVDAGIVPSSAPPPAPEAELALYELLRAEPGDAYSRYNALKRELDSFAAAAERLREEGA